MEQVIAVARRAAVRARGVCWACSAWAIAFYCLSSSVYAGTTAAAGPTWQTVALGGIGLLATAAGIIARGVEKRQDKTDAVLRETRIGLERLRLEFAWHKGASGRQLAFREVDEE